MSPQFPWDYASDLTAERLLTVAQLIVDGRHAAVERYDEQAGDNGWTLGCRAFQFGRARILRAAESGDYPWLTVIDQSLQLIFKIGEVPVRIYRGDADEPNERTLRQSFAEFRQLSLVFPEEDAGYGLLYRFAVETDFDGTVSSIKFVGLRGEVVAFCWDVPIERDVLPLPARTGVAEPGVDLPAPAVAVRAPRAA